MPQQHMVIPHYMRNSKEMVVERRIAEDTYKDIKRQDSDSSLSSFQDIPLLIPQEADGPSACNEDSKSRELDMNHDFDDQPSRDSKFPFSLSKLKNEPSVAAMPMKGCVDDLDFLALKRDLSSDVLHPSSGTPEKEWWETQEQGDQVVSADESEQFGPRVSCRCQVTRSWNSPFLFAIILVYLVFSPHPTIFFCTAINNLGLSFTRQLYVYNTGNNMF